MNRAEQILSYLQKLHNSDLKSVPKRLIPAGEITPKQMRNVLKLYGTDVPQGEIVALLDDSTFGNGKDGFLVTTTALYPTKYQFTDAGYGKHNIPVPIVYDTLKEVRVYNSTSNYSRSPIYLRLAYKDGTAIETYLGYFTPYMNELLNTILKLQNSRAAALARRAAAAIPLDQQIQELLEKGTAAYKRGNTSIALQHFEAAANLGSVKGAEMVGGVFGYLTEYDQAEAWLRKAQKMGSTRVDKIRSQIRQTIPSLAAPSEADIQKAKDAVKTGQEAVRNGKHQEAFVSYMVAADLNSPEGCFLAAQIYLTFIENPVMLKDGLSLALKAKHLGHKDANELANQIRVVIAYYTGTDLIKKNDLQQALEYMQEAAALGSGRAALMTGALMEKIGLFWKKREEIIQYYRQAAETNIPEAVVDLCRVLIRSGEFDEAELWLLKAKPGLEGEYARAVEGYLDIIRSFREKGAAKKAP